MPINATGGTGELVTGVPESDRDRDPFLNPGLLGRLWRHSVAQSAWSFGGQLEGL